ncbi:hypothetical protein ACLOJK_013727 [Asimina triloba]
MRDPRPACGSRFTASRHIKKDNCHHRTSSCSSVAAAPRVELTPISMSAWRFPSFPFLNSGIWSGRWTSTVHVQPLPLKTMPQNQAELGNPRNRISRFFCTRGTSRHPPPVVVVLVTDLLSSPILAVLVKSSAAVPFLLLSSSSHRPCHRSAVVVDSRCPRRQSAVVADSHHSRRVLSSSCRVYPASPVSSHPSVSPPPSLILLLCLPYGLPRLPCISPPSTAPIETRQCATRPIRLPAVPTIRPILTPPSPFQRHQAHYITATTRLHPVRIKVEMNPNFMSLNYTLTNQDMVLKTRLNEKSRTILSDRIILNSESPIERDLNE